MIPLGKVATIMEPPPHLCSCSSQPLSPVGASLLLKQSTNLIDFILPKNHRTPGVLQTALHSNYQSYWFIFNINKNNYNHLPPRIIGL